MERRKTRAVKVGGVIIGGGHPVVIQSMTKTSTSDIDATVSQIRRLEECGCEIVRLAIKEESDALALKEIKRQTTIPLVADIHFHGDLALKAIDNGADKIRLNPGNIRKESQIKEIVSALKAARIPLRIGVNSGSVASAGRRNATLAAQLVGAAVSYIRIVEKQGFHDICLSLKASNIEDTVAAYRAMSKRTDYPLHLGVTATGTPLNGLMKSGIALGILLREGIGDTLRVSLTDAPEQEVRAGQALLEALELRSFGPYVISCPTCGRCEVDLVSLVKEFSSEAARSGIVWKNRKPVKVALMGCMVNGPGEAKEADIGIAFGRNTGMLFKNGKPVRKVPFDQCVRMLLREMKGSKKTAGGSSRTGMERPT